MSDTLETRIAGSLAKFDLRAQQIILPWFTHRFQGRKKRVRTLGIAAAAAALGVTRQHLYYVLRNKRHSPILLHRYNQLRRAA